MKKMALLVIFLLFVFAGSIVTIYTDYLWFVEVGYTGVFWTILKAKAVLFAIGAAAVGLLLWINARITGGPSRGTLMVWDENLLEIRQREEIEPVIRSLLPAGTVVVALLAGIICTSLWDKALRYLHPTNFGIADPLFGRDVGFYVFQLPFLQSLFRGSLTVLILCVILSACLYLFGGKVAASQHTVVAAPQVKPHLLTLVGLVLLVKAWGYRLSMFELLYSPRGVAYGASYTDVHAELPVLKLLLMVAGLAGIVVIISAYRPGWKVAATAIGVWIAVALVGGKGLPLMIQKLHVAPNELNVERPYIEHNIRFTRAAYNLNNVEEKDFAAEESLTPEVLKKNNLTIQNIRLWDYRPLLTVYKQLQEIRTYYDFNDVDVDRYTIGGRYQQVMLSAREISSERLPSRLWINERLTYTHGYGAVVSPVNRIASDGLPEFLVKNIPPVETSITKYETPTTNSPLRITRPEIYYGELPNDYVFVATRAREFDYPAGEKNVYTTYTGNGGVPVGGFWRRLAFAFRFRSLPILLNHDITAGSRVMYYRRVKERLQRIAPFLTFDPDPYLVISRGRLFWICDAYTLTDMYPYSQPTYGIGANYIRNSVKAVVNAYDGQVNLYVADVSDPILQTYRRIFPNLFQPMESMESDLRRHLRYPRTLFAVQAKMYAVFHMKDPQVFYNKEDVWETPAVGISAISPVAAAPQPQPTGGPYASPRAPVAAPPRETMEPYYTIMKLPDAAKEEFIQLIPFTPARKNNLRAWMCARIDPPNYGKLLVYNFPKAKLVYGPSQVNARIEQDARISQQLTLWRQGGSDVIRGELLIIPVEQSLLYIQSLYLKAAEGEIPELKRVIAAYGDKIAMEANLEQSLTALFGKGISPPTAVLAHKRAGQQSPTALRPMPPAGARDLAREALQHLQEARDCYRRDDWAGFGEALNRLEESLRRVSE